MMSLIPVEERSTHHVVRTHGDVRDLDDVADDKTAIEAVESNYLLDDMARGK